MSPTPPAPNWSAPIWSASGVLQHGMLAVDIVGFGRHDPALHTYLRDALYRIVTNSLAQIGVPLQSCHREDRGDAVLVITPASVSVEPLLGHWIHQLRAALRHYNQISAATAQLRLRVGIHAGFVKADHYGVAGRAILHLCRLLDAPAFKTALETSQSDVGLITSDYLYQEVVRDGPGLIDPATFTPISVNAKETRGRAWIYLPPPPAGIPQPPATPSTICAPSQTRTARGPRSHGLHRGPGHRH
ncbi:hypothetical protein [Actinomadura sp. 6N118]|uniref:hypothetical protein n=1 Tax=Actinomadura sp. 6N118 TaxID=3375151 RepID=UPI0037B77C4A